MRSLHLNLNRCLLALIAWLALTIGMSLHAAPEHPAQLWESVSGGISWPLLLAAMAVTGLVLVSDRRALGLRLPTPAGTVRLAWLPFLYALTACLLAAGGPPLPDAQVGMVLMNTSLAALSEEVMFRGILLYGLMTRLKVVPAVLVSSALFGAVHALNVLTTGDLVAALWQALAAALQGVGFAAVRLRTRSLLPIIVVHAMYDCGLLLLAARAHPAAGMSGAEGFVAILAVVPVFVYGLFLLRKQASLREPLAFPERFN